MMRLGVIILNYNTCDLLRRCLHSVLSAAARCVARLNVDVLVVDSASADGSAQMVAVEFPQVHLVASPVNLGYTGGNNLGLHLFGFPVAVPETSTVTLPTGLPKPDFVLLLNADTEIVGDALWAMVQALMAQPNAGACGGHLQYGDGVFQPSAFCFPTLMQLAADLLPLATMPAVRTVWPRFYASRFNGRYPMAKWQAGEPFAVDFVLGAAIMVRAGVIEQVGGLDDGYFLYCEEMDWCLRMAEAGWSVLAVPAARILHHEGQSSRQVRWPAYERLWRSRLRFYQKHARHYPAGYLWLVRFLVRIGMAWRSRLAERRFAHGEITGAEIAAELNTYAAITELWLQNDCLG